MNKEISILAKILVCSLSVIFILIILFLATIKYQDTKRLKSLHIFSTQILNFELPTGTALLESKSAVGTLSGMGNHYSYCTILLVKSDLTTQELTNYYLKKYFSPAENKESNIITKILPATSPELSLTDIDNINPPLTFQSIANLDDYNNYYFVVIIDGQYKYWESINSKVFSS